MTCPFYVCDGRPECILGDTRAERHCGPRTYPAHSCTLDAIGEWGAWRAGLAVVEDAARYANEMGNLLRIARAINAVGAVGWSP
jgi:hypothetical protein